MSIILQSFWLHLTEQSPTVIAIFTLSTLYTLYYLFQHANTYHRRSLLIRQHGCKPPKAYPHKDPVLGLDIFLDNVRAFKEGVFVENIINRYKTLATNNFSFIFWGKTIISTTEPANIKTILSTSFADFVLPSSRKNAMGPVFGHGIFTTDGKAWEHSRAMLRPNFTRTQFADLDVFERHVSAMIDKIPKDGREVDLQKLFFDLTIDSASELLFGTSTGVLEDAEGSQQGREFAEAFNYSMHKVGFEIRAGRLASYIPDKKLKKSIKIVHEYVQGYVKKAIEKAEKLETSEEKEDRYVFLDELAKDKYSAKQMQDEALNIILAGRDTTAGLLSLLFYVLARQPDVFTKLREEILKLNNEQPSYEQIKDMKYLRYCINETLRLYPIVPLNNRSAIVDTVLPVGGGPDGKSPILVKKGQQVNYSIAATHRRKDLYGEDADEFKPERWETLRPGWEYLPFNGGPRICIGQQLALTEASYTTIRLIQAFKDVEARDTEPWREWLTLTLAIKNGCKVAMIPA